MRQVETFNFSAGHKIGYTALSDSSIVRVTAGDPCILAEVKIDSPGTYYVCYSVDAGVIMNLKQLVLEYLQFKILYHSAKFPLSKLPPELRDEVEGPGHFGRYSLHLNGTKIYSSIGYGCTYPLLELKTDDILQCRVAPHETFDRKVFGSLRAVQVSEGQKLKSKGSSNLKA